MRITIPIYFTSEVNATLLELELKTSIDNDDVKDVTFFRIDYLTTHFIDGKEYTLIGVNNEDLFSPMSKEQILKLIDEQV